MHLYRTPLHFSPSLLFLISCVVYTNYFKYIHLGTYVEMKKLQESIEHRLEVIEHGLDKPEDIREVGEDGNCADVSECDISGTKIIYV